MFLYGLIKIWIKRLISSQFISSRSRCLKLCDAYAFAKMMQITEGDEKKADVLEQYVKTIDEKITDRSITSDQIFEYLEGLLS